MKESMYRSWPCSVSHTHKILKKVHGPVWDSETGVPLGYSLLEVVDNIAKCSSFQQTVNTVVQLMVHVYDNDGMMSWWLVSILFVVPCYSKQTRVLILQPFRFTSSCSRLFIFWERMCNLSVYTVSWEETVQEQITRQSSRFRLSPFHPSPADPLSRSWTSWPHANENWIAA